METLLVEKLNLLSESLIHVQLTDHCILVDRLVLFVRELRMSVEMVCNVVVHSCSFQEDLDQVAPLHMFLSVVVLAADVPLKLVIVVAVVFKTPLLLRPAVSYISGVVDSILIFVITTPLE